MFALKPNKIRGKAALETTLTVRGVAAYLFRVLGVNLVFPGARQWGISPGFPEGLSPFRGFPRFHEGTWNSPQLLVSYRVPKHSD